MAVWQDADQAREGETVAESVANARRKTKSKDGNPGSTVEQFGSTHCVVGYALCYTCMS